MKPKPQALPGQTPFNSEMISELKRGKRGKKPKFAAADYERLAKYRPQTQRGRQNLIYAEQAAKTLLQLGEDRFAYLLSPVFRTTILSELGRFGHPSVLVSAATEICASRMKTAKAVGLCRRMRGKGSPNFSELAKKIRRTIQDYRDRHPNLSEAEIATALRMVPYP